MEDILCTLSKKLHIDNKHEQYHTEYSLLNTDEDRVMYTMKLLQEYDIAPVIINNRKDINKSTEYKNEANKLYTMPKKTSQLQLNEIIELYTMSVAYAPPKSRELSLAYANRSAALFAARLYDDCLIDIERALALNYPNELKAKLYARRVRCLSILNVNSSDELNDALDKTRAWLEKMDLNNAGRVIVEKTLNNSMNIKIEKPRIKLDDERNLPEIPNDNKEIPGASSAIAINYSEEFGRHIVATRDIEPGELIVAQKNYSWVLDPEKYYSNCWNCSKQTWCGISCDYCVEAIYCCEICRDEAWNDYHDVECQVVGPLIALQMAHLTLMSLRLTIKAVREAGSIEKLMNKLPALDSHTDDRTCGFVDNIFDHQKYESMYSLTRNTEKRSVPDLFGRSLNSFYIAFMLATRSEFFGKKLSNDMKNLEQNKLVIFIGGLIMRHQQIIPSNVHSMNEECIVNEPVSRGAAIMPFLSLFNHSCSPMVNRKSFGKVMALYAECIIKKGDQIFDNYGMCYALHTKTVRQRSLLRQYYFVCNCIACIEDWPLYANLPSYKDQKLPKHVMKKIAKAFKNYDVYFERASVGNVDNAPQMSRELAHMISCLHQNVKLPCIELNNAIETLKRIHALQGSLWQSLD
ncbi:hypothetical protein PV327_009484 [Microctonus hyperodae]|uniref:Protein-lysine N-methyltransferase SMYD4 n=1 Tax=Microctonus hyperodae TaxID=165561 RepID=A0AA39FU53_MICHY|nr:hypothetical protein PV327_009484 [Microctonus hyperodae]